MKKITFFITVLLTGFAINLSAQNSSEGAISANAEAKLIKAMTLAENAQLDFGSNLLLDASGGTVVLPSDSNTRTYGGDGVAAAAVGPAVNGIYTVTGTADESYALTLPQGFNVTHVDGGGGNVANMTVTSILARFNGANGDATTSALAPDGTDSFTLGATLTVGNNQKAGVYTGTFPISVDYN
jgi:hypothetical protein